MLHETKKLEFKSDTPGDIYKEIIAFANTGGGTLLIGTNNAGEAAPLRDIDDTYLRITNGIRDAIAPDVTMVVKYTLEDNEDEQRVRVEIGEGSFKPYYLKMIQVADGDSFEKLRSLDQELTFRFCADVFDKHKIAFGEDKYNALGIRSHAQQLYTNLGWLLSDQCAHSVKVAVFADEQNTVFRDRKEFTGSVLRQLEDTFNYLQLCNKTRSVIDGVARKDYWDYPKEAIREALLNALIHRDYGFSGSIIINVNDVCMEFISIGGLLPGISTEDIRNGISLLRNENLAEIFLRLNFIEAYGTGIRRIFSLYKDCPVQPTIVVTPNSFKIALPNMNTATGEVDSTSEEIITPQMQTLLDYLSEHGEISDEGIQVLLGIKRTRAFTLTKQMAEIGLIEIVGRGKNKKIKVRQSSLY